MNANHPLTKLSAAEASLISSIDAAAARLDAVGTSAVESAIDRRRASAHAAGVRLRDAGSLVASIAGDVLGYVLGEATGIQNAIRADAVPASVEPHRVEPVNGYVYTEPTDDPDILHTLPAPEVLARLPFLFAGQRPADPEPTPEPKRTGLPLVDEFLSIAREAEVETKGPVPEVERDTPIEKYPAAPDPAFTTDGPTLVDRHGNPDDDPTAVLVKSHAVPYVAPTQTPARRRKSR